MNSFLSVGQATTISVYVTNSSPAFYNTQVQVDGTTVGVTTEWFGGSAPSAGNANSVDFYTYNIVKTAASTYTVFASFKIPILRTFPTFELMLYPLYIGIMFEAFC